MQRSLTVEEEIANLTSAETAPEKAGPTFVRLSVPAVRALALHVKSTPRDCTVDAIKDAHASLIGMTRAIRAQLVALLDEALDAR